MRHEQDFYIGGRWERPLENRRLEVIDPSTEAAFATISNGSAADINRAVASAKAAFPAYSRTSKAERIDLLRRIARAYERSADELATSLSREMGAPIAFARSAQVPSGLHHLLKMIAVLEQFEFEAVRGRTLIRKEPVGVCGLITPWNWPLNQIVCKVAPALAAGCTMVLKPSEVAPLSALLFADLLDRAGIPPGVFNLVNGDGPTLGGALAAHPDVDMISITGSTAAGISVAKVAADTVKRVHQELGGKSANIILPSADLRSSVTRGVHACFRNSGQSCNAPTRMFIHSRAYAEAVAIARDAANEVRIGPPESSETTMGPLANLRQFEKVQHYISLGLSEGAELIAGGPGRPAGLKTGYYALPTIFGSVRPHMRIAQEEIFGPVLSLMTYDNEDEVIALANDSPYGLAAYIQGEDLPQACRVASQVRAGTIYVNYPPPDFGAPFGGFKRSGNGREYADFGLESFLEIKGIVHRF